MQYLLRKQIIIGVFLLCSSFASLAQRGEVYQPYHDELPFYLGMSIGVNNSFYNFNRNVEFINPVAGSVYEINPRNNLALNLGIIGTFRLTKHSLLRLNPMVLIAGSKNIYNYREVGQPGVKTMNITPAIFTIPLAFKLESDRYIAFHYNDIMRHYVFIGGKIDYDLLGANKAVVTSNVSSARTLVPYNLRSVDFGYEMGLGLSFYLQYATISPEVKFSYGLKNLNKGDALLSSIRNISDNFVYFTIHIEN